jgi:hypothetical protein
MVGRVAAHCCAAGHVLPLPPCARGSATCVSDAWPTRCHHLCEGLGRAVRCGIGHFLSPFLLSTLLCTVALMHWAHTAIFVCFRPLHPLDCSIDGRYERCPWPSWPRVSERRGGEHSHVSVRRHDSLCGRRHTHPLCSGADLCGSRLQVCSPTHHPHTHTVPHADVTLGPMQQRHAVLVR